MNPRLRQVVLLALAAFALTAAIAPVSSAHEGEGTIEVLAAEPAAPLEVAYRVRLTFTEDGHPAADATVTAVAERPGAAPTTPQPMTATGEEGVYAATVRFPDAGQWTVRFTAVTPEATLERAETVAPPPTTTTTTSTTTTTTEPPATTAPTPRLDRGDDGGVPLLPVALGGVALAVAAGVLTARRRRR